MINVIIIGVGKLGSRHLQALAKLTIPVTIHVVDTNKESLKIAKERYEEIPVNSNVIAIHYNRHIENINTKKADIAIIATTSEHRRKIIEDLTSVIEIKFLVLEKILFQKIDDYKQIGKLLKEQNITTWVNCSRRQWDVYKKMKEVLKDKKVLEVTVFGQNWSLATSSIHFIDLISYLTSETNYQILNLDFNEEVYPAYSSVTGAKSSKYIEFYGSLKGRFAQDIYFNFTCIKDNTLPFYIRILTDKGSIQIYEEIGKVYYETHDVEKNSVFIPSIFTVPYQSDSTNKVVEDIVLSQSCDLATFEESSLLHIPLIQSFLNYTRSIKQEEIVACPIT